MPFLSQLHVHPVKSMRALQLSHAQATLSGLAFDRQFMLTKPDGTFITARQYPQLLCFTPAILDSGVVITAPDGEQCHIRYTDFSSSPAAPTEVWGNTFTSLIAPVAVNQWISRYLHQELQLRWIGQHSTRRVKPYPQTPLSFADGFPYLLVSQSSFDALQQRCSTDIHLKQFRPNLVIDNAEAFDEDSWQSLRIGDVIFDVVKPCSRCVLTTIDHEQGQKEPQGEPLRTLQSFRTAENGDIDFGQNLLARNEGVIRVGDRIEIISRKPARHYYSSKPTESLPNPNKAAALKPLLISYRGYQFEGNNQHTVLEQLEQQGIKIPYSCRAGICGSCYLTLLSGQVTPLKQSAIKENDEILSCSCIPKSSIELI